MAKGKRTPRTPKAMRKIKTTMHEWGSGKLRSGGSGKKVTSQKQAVAIALAQARRAVYGRRRSK